ncbi:putative ribonuclease H-like domain-containing protein [Tanacetum coccineum]
MCDKKNSVLFTDTECVVLSSDFKLTDESHVLLKVPKKDNMYSVDLKNVAPSGGLTCLFVKATLDESNLWHRRLGHVNFKTINKLVKGNLVRGLPSKLFEINQTCVAYQKGKQHRAYYLRVKVIRCDNWTEFKNRVMNQFYEMKGIKRKFSVARTPQQNRVAERVLVIKPHNTTPYELFLGRKPALSFMRPFGCHVTILNTIDHLDALTKSMNYKPVVAENQSNDSAGTKACDNVGKVGVETVPHKDYILLSFLTQDPPFSSSSKDSPDAGFKPSGEDEKKNTEDDVGKKFIEVTETKNGVSSKEDDKDDQDLRDEFESLIQQEKNGENDVNITNNINNVSSTINTTSIKDNVVDENIVYGCADDPNMPNLEEIVYSDDDEDVGAEADMTNLDTHIPVSPILTTRIYEDHPVEQIIRDIHSTPQTRRMTKNVTNHVEPKKTLVDLPYGKRAIGTKWIYRNKKDERGIVVRNKARLVAQGYTQEGGIDYNEVFASVARIKTIRLFLAYASFKDFVVYQMDVKSAFLYGKIEEEVYVCQPSGFEDIEFTDRVYKVEKHYMVYIKLLELGMILYLPIYWTMDFTGEMCTEFEKMMHKKFQMSSMGELTFFLGLQVTQKDDGIFISQDKYVDEILKKFGFSTVKTASTPMETSKPLLKDAEAEDVDVHLYRSMIGSLMYLTSSRPDIMFAVCACARFQVSPKVLHLHAVKKIFRYLKGQPKLGLWYHKDSPFDLEAYTDGDYADARLDKKSTTGGCQFLGSRLILWQCKKETVVSNSTTEADTICIVKNPVFHSKTKHIEIRHHFIKDSYEKRLIQVIKIHTDYNVADLLTKAFDIDDWNGLEILFDKIRVYTGNSRVNVAGRKVSDTRQKVNAAGLTVFNDEYNTPSHTKKVFANMRRPGKDFSGTVTPLFPSMLASQAAEGEDEAVHEERRDSVENVATTAASLEVEQDSGNINRTQSTAIPNVPFPQGIGSGGSPRCQEAMGDTIAQTRSERVSTPSYDSPLLGVNTPGSNEERIELKDLIDMCTKLSDRVLDLENVKDAQALEIKKLTKRVKKLERRNKSRTPQPKRRVYKPIVKSTEESLGEKNSSKQRRNSNKTEELNVAEEEHMFDLYDLTGKKVIVYQEKPTELVEDKGSVEKSVSVAEDKDSTAGPVTTVDDVTLAENLMAIRRSASRPQKLKGVVFKEPSEQTTTTSRPQLHIPAKYKGKGIMQEPKKLVKVKDKDQIAYDADVAQTLQEELDEEARLEREREEEASNVALIEECDSIKSRIDSDAQLAERLQAEEREQMSVEEQARLLMEFIASREKFFAAKRAEEQRNKPPTKAEQRKKTCTYMKHMAGYKDKNFKGKSFDAIKQMFDKAYEQVNDFVPMDTESSGKKVDSSGKKEKSSKKRTRAVLDEESVKRQKLEDDAEKAELKACLEIVPGDDSAVNIESLATKYPIVDWKTHILAEDNIYYQIIRADGSTKYYKIFSAMLDDFDRQDVLDLYRLVKERFETTSLEGYDRLLWGDLITLFEPSEEDEIWKTQQDYTFLSWKLYDSCEVHLLLMDTRSFIHVLVEKNYPLTQEMLSIMLSGRQEVDHECEMAFELLRFTRSQLKK